MFSQGRDRLQLSPHCCAEGFSLQNSGMQRPSPPFSATGSFLTQRDCLEMEIPGLPVFVRQRSKRTYWVACHTVVVPLIFLLLFFY